MAYKEITIVIVDDHDILRHSLKHALLEQEGVKVLGDTGNGLAAVMLAEKWSPNVMIMDINMPDLNGIEATKQILSKNPDINIIALSMLSEASVVKRMLNAGAKGFLLKTCSFDELYKAVLSVAAGKSYLCPEALEVVMDTVRNPCHGDTVSDLEKLTARERTILQLIAEGRSSSQIAKKLYISKRTVDIHRTNIMNKLKIRSIAGLTKFAIKEGLITL